MILKKKEIKYCQACGKNKLPEDPATVVMGDHRFLICGECEKLFSVLNEKMKEMEQRSIEEDILR